MLMLMFFPLSAREPEARAPGDIESLNRYAAEYNRYVQELGAGKRDVRQWSRTEDARKQVH